MTKMIAQGANLYVDIYIYVYEIHAHTLGCSYTCIDIVFFVYGGRFLDDFCFFWELFQFLFSSLALWPLWLFWVAFVALPGFTMLYLSNYRSIYLI